MSSLIVALALPACSTSDDAAPPATVMGTISGSVFEPKDAVAIIDQVHKSATIVVSSTPNLCADLRDHVQRANSRVLVMMVFDDASADLALSPGTYTASYDSSPSRCGLFESNVTDAQCNVSYDPPPDGTGEGTITLATVNETTLTGSFDVVLENSDHITGTFSPPACTGLGPVHGTPTCK